MSEVLEGEICHWSPTRGFGFIKPTAGNDVFVHFRQVRGGYQTLAVGQRVKFREGVNRNTQRPCAVDVEVCEPVISPRPTPRAYRDDADDRGEAEQLAATAFMSAKGAAP